MAKNEVSGTTDEPEIVAPRRMTREELRELAFSPEKTIVDRIPIKFNGVDLEWQRPSIREIQEQQDNGDRNFILSLIVGYSYIPNSEEKFFEDSDYEKIRQMPFSRDYSDTVNTLVKALNLNVEEKVKN